MSEGFAMRLVATASVLLLVGAPIFGCAELSPTADTPPVVSVACANDILGDVAVLDWELIVSHEPIESGKPFDATLSGFAVFGESFLDDSQPLFSGGVEEVDLVEFNATVHVREGAAGDDVILEPEPIPYTCNIGRNACDPANDVPDEPPRLPGNRANTDCEPVNFQNPCGRYIRLPTSTDCEPGGICEGRGKTGPNSQCEDNGFCITGDLRIRLKEATGQYTAASEGKVLFGWADESTGATIQEGGPNDGTWVIPLPVYEEPTGPVGARVTVGGVPTAFDCTMGVDCSDPVLGVDCGNTELSSPTPNEALIAFPIQAKAF